jgi:hypothetical protein
MARRRCVNSPFRITTVYGNVPGYPLNNGFHTGVDYVSNDSLIVAPMDSVISATGYDSVNGNYLVLDSNGYRDWFSHIKEYKLKSGSVKAGQALAVMGATGAATGVHVHHSLRVNGVMVDPEKYITEVNMPVKTSISTARILGEGILGRDRDLIHAGKLDTDLNANHVNKDLTNEYIYQLWTSAESKAAANVRKQHKDFYNTYVTKIAELSARPTKEELAKLGEALKAEQAKVVEAEKKLADEIAKDDATAEENVRSFFDKLMDLVFRR